MRIELKENNRPTREEILELAKGQRSVTIAGEEPLKRVKLAEIIAEMDCEEIWIETDGLEAAYMAEKLKKAGVTGIKFLINSLNNTKYSKTNDKKSLDEVFKGINAATDAGMTVRFYVKIEKGFNDMEIIDFLQLTLQHRYEIVFVQPEGMTNDDIKAKMPALRPTQYQTEDVEFFAYPMSQGKIGFPRVMQ